MTDYPPSQAAMDVDAALGHLDLLVKAADRLAIAAERVAAADADDRDNYVVRVKMTTAADLSRLLFNARERISMQVDVVESQTGRADNWGSALVGEIDRLRALQGWSPDGFGGEE